MPTRPSPRGKQPIRVAGFERFAMVPEWLYSHPDATPQAIAAWIGLWHYADRESHRTIVRRRLLAEMAPGSPSQATIDRWVQQLVDLGAVEITPRVTDGGQTSNEYLLHWTAAEMRTPLLTDEDGPLTSDGEPPSSPARTPIREQEPEIKNHPEQEEEPQRFVDTFEAETVPEPVVERPRNLHWDALEHVFGYRPAENEARRWGQVVKTLKERGATPEEIITRAGRILQTWGSGALTINSLEKHWERMGSPLATITERAVDEWKASLEWPGFEDAVAEAMAEPEPDWQEDAQDEARALLARAREFQRQLDQGANDGE